MSLTKRMMEEQQEKCETAKDVAVRAGVLERCEVCDEVTNAYAEDTETAYKLANTLISRGDPLVEAFNGDRRELTDLIKEVVDEAPDDCYCESKIAWHMARD